MQQPFGTVQEKKVAEKTVLELDDELIEQGRIFALKSFSYCEILLANLLVGCRGSGWGEDRANCRNCAHPCSIRR